MDQMSPKRKAGLWIDHRKAVITIFSAEGQETLELKSNLENQEGRDEGRRSTVPHETHLMKADDIRQRVTSSKLNRYYAQVSDALQGIDSVLVFGPGEAKGEFKKHFERAKRSGRVVALQTTDELTNGQIVAKVRAFFLDQD